ncbi:hypothetical protein HYH03_007561 [Edaphochlamys debaryana]|uniref:Methyltransferase domain-containing protein n=1 Tax=Edaphochlamys debaryana TaxID=47281 RepID=A0A836C079_9CHLO|nr:hypothetical protein HYH03_007561 [Edaphochlamys debaryana]|eukprot:KAG2494203.1 hypothetical protein HYH03_007561 [Edaphochlamys debaryana]
MVRSGQRLNETSSLLFSEETGALDKRGAESAPGTPRGESPARDAGGLNTIKSVLQFVASPAFVEDDEAGGGVSLETLNRVCGRGFAPWEVHRPQQAVRELLTGGAFKGAVLDCGCGIGDNALFVAKYTTCTVDAVDILPKCIAFAEMKAGLRNMRGRVGWQCFDVLKWDSSPLASRTAHYDVVLDSGLLHFLGAEAKRRYLQVLHAALKPGGTLHLLALSDQETSPGGPTRVSRAELDALLGAEAGWSLTSVKPHYMELHPTFWGGRGQAYLASAQRL